MIEDVVSFKIIIVGDSFCGKTSIMNRYVNDVFKADEKPTVGSGNATKTISFNGNTYNLIIWDTAGQEAFHGVVPVYYHNADAAIIVFDITNTKSFNSIDYWIKSLKEEAPETIGLYLCANKIDLSDRQAVDSEIIAEKSNSLGIHYFETSALSGQGIFKLFQAIFSDLIRKPPKDSQNSTQTQTGSTSCC